MSQMKLTITRDPRAAAMISPAKGLEASKLKSPSTGKSLKSVKGKTRPQASSCHQTLLKFVSKANSKPKILKTLSENSVQVELKPKYISSGSSLQTSENNSKVIATLSENSVIMNEKSKTRENLEENTKVEEMNSDHCISLETGSADPNPSKTNPSAQLLPSIALPSTTKSLSTVSEISNTTTTNLPTIMSSHPVTSVLQSRFKQVPSKTSAATKPVMVQVLPTSSKEQVVPATTSVINSSPAIVKCPSKVMAVKTSPSLLAQHLHYSVNLSPVSTVTSSKENSTDSFQSLVSGKRASATVSMASSTMHVEASNPVLNPPQPKKCRRQTAAVLPVSRVRTIMKTNFQSSKSGPQLGQESVPIVCKAAVSCLVVIFICVL